MTIDDLFSFFMSALQYPVARQLAGGGALYWRWRKFGYQSRSRVDPSLALRNVNRFPGEPVQKYGVSAAGRDGIRAVVQYP
ncbi:MAG TPA: hypothetical protein VGQ27_13120, partial [Steroidobacteraceae bacterium]|nr:hypothetical protein [Steroidobacteraceae bacterium]